MEKSYQEIQKERQGHFIKIYKETFGKEPVFGDPNDSYNRTFTLNIYGVKCNWV